MITSERICVVLIYIGQIDKSILQHLFWWRLICNSEQTRLIQLKYSTIRIWSANSSTKPVFRMRSVEVALYWSNGQMVIPPRVSCTCSSVAGTPKLWIASATSSREGNGAFRTGKSEQQIIVNPKSTLMEIVLGPKNLKPAFMPPWMFVFSNDSSFCCKAATPLETISSILLFNGLLIDWAVWQSVSFQTYYVY